MLLQLMAIAIARLIGFDVCRARQQSHQAGLIRIAHGRFAICLDPFGMLDPQVKVNLFPQVRVGVDLVDHDFDPTLRLFRGHRHCIGQQNHRPDGNGYNYPEGD